MPIIYADTQDGYVNHTNTSDWETSRDATTGTTSSTVATGSNLAIRSDKSATRTGGTQWTIGRVFFEFDTSDILSTPANATLNIYGYTNTSADFFVVKSTHGVSLTTADFDAITGWSTGSSDGSGAGDNEGNVTKFSTEITSWNGSGYNSIQLNSAALADMFNLNQTTLCLIESVHDLRDIEPSGTNRSGLYFRDYTGSTRDPYIDYETGVGANWFGTNF